MALLSACVAAGLNCQVSHCCQELAYNNSLRLAQLFNVSGHNIQGHVLETRHSAGYSAACSFLNLVPGVFDQDQAGVCSDLAVGMENTTVCEAISSSAEERDRLLAERPSWEPFSVTSVFVEPGTCAELQNDTCLESREGNAIYSWDDTARSVEWCAQHGFGADVFQWGMTCVQDGGLQVQAKWLSAAPVSYVCSSDGSDNYSDGMQVVLGTDDWLGGSGGSLHWQCFDVPGGPSDHRMLAYSVGDLPCVVGTSAFSSDSSSTSLAAIAHVAAAAVAVGAMA
jgi:hypothetical protein